LTRSDRLKALDSAPRPLVTPSLLNCNFSRIAEELKALEQAGTLAVHLDVMDGHFVPNLSYGAPVIADWRPCTDLPFDAHLMMSEPARYLDDFIKAGCDEILVHIEVLPDPVPVLRRIRDAGCHAGLVLNPPTPVESVLPFLSEVDKILVMSVMPGFGGQAFEPSVLDKVRRLRKERPEMPIVIDGGIKAHNAAEVVEAGVTQLVVGSAIFRPDGNYAEALTEVVEAARRGLQCGGGSPGTGGSS
jgi:ribulose-phosphate 3-epimerase